VIGIGGGNDPPDAFLHVNSGRALSSRALGISQIQISELVGGLPDMRMYIDDHNALHVSWPAGPGQK